MSNYIMRNANLIGFLSILAVFSLFCSCKQSTEEEKILAFIEETRLAFESKDIGFIAGHVSADYEDPHGLSSFEAIGIVRRLFLRFQQWEVRVYKPKIRVDGDEAKVVVSIKIRVSEQANSRFLLGSGEEYLPIEVRLRREGKEYKAIRVSGLKESRDFSTL